MPAGYTIRPTLSCWAIAIPLMKPNASRGAHYPTLESCVRRLVTQLLPIRVRRLLLTPNRFGCDSRRFTQLALFVSLADLA
jgi:hypothetical protein